MLQTNPQRDVSTDVQEARKPDFQENSVEENLLTYISDSDDCFGVLPPINLDLDESLEPWIDADLQVDLQTIEEDASAHFPESQPLPLPSATAALACKEVQATRRVDFRPFHLSECDALQDKQLQNSKFCSLILSSDEVEPAPPFSAASPLCQQHRTGQVADISPFVLQQQKNRTWVAVAGSEKRSTNAEAVDFCNLRQLSSNPPGVITPMPSSLRPLKAQEQDDLLLNIAGNGSPTQGRAIDAQLSCPVDSAFQHMQFATGSCHAGLGVGRKVAQNGRVESPSKEELQARAALLQRYWQLLALRRKQLELRGQQQKLNEREHDGTPEPTGKASSDSISSPQACNTPQEQFFSHQSPRSSSVPPPASPQEQLQPNMRTAASLQHEAAQAAPTNNFPQVADDGRLCGASPKSWVHPASRTTMGPSSPQNRSNNTHQAKRSRPVGEQASEEEGTLKRKIAALKVENTNLRKQAKRFHSLLCLWATQGFVTPDQALQFLASDECRQVASN